jgi:hypothetical protein
VPFVAGDSVANDEVGSNRADALRLERGGVQAPGTLTLLGPQHAAHSRVDSGENLRMRARVGIASTKCLCYRGKVENRAKARVSFSYWRQWVCPEAGR